MVDQIVGHNLRKLYAAKGLRLRDDHLERAVWWQRLCSSRRMALLTVIDSVP